MRKKRLIAAIAGVLTLTAGVGVAQAAVSTDKAATERSTDEATETTETADEESAKAADEELDCRETADRYKDKNRVYLYTYSYCKGGNDAWSPTQSDPNYNDDKGPIRKFNNRTDSIVNTTKKHVAFYNEPNYEGDNFCLRPGNYIRRLYVYGDGGGTNDWWSNSISSHKLVDAGDCDRWFGWLVP